MVEATDSLDEFCFSQFDRKMTSCTACGVSLPPSVISPVSGGGLLSEARCGPDLELFLVDLVMYIEG